MPVAGLENGGAVMTLEEPPAWTPFDVFTWVAFGERRSGADYLFPRTEWSLDWGHWPPQNLAQAFDEISSGVPWKPFPGSLEAGWADADRAWAREIMDRTEMSALELSWVLDADIQNYCRSEARYQNAKAEVMKAIREGRLPVWARKAQGSARPNHAALPELLNHRLFTHDEAREVNEGAWVDGSGAYKGPWWDQVRFDADKVQAIWPAPPLGTGIASSPQPFPAAARIAPWLAVCWLAFGTLNTPPHIARHRSFDGGNGRFPDEGETRYAARQAEHRRFDAAERKLLDLLASGPVKAIGQQPARTKAGSRLHHPAPAHVDIPATAFLNRELAFVINGELIPRLSTQDRSFPPLELRGSEADPGFTHYYDVLIEVAELREAWGIAPVSQPEAPPLEVAASAPRKRKHTGLDFRSLDAPLVNEMRRMIEAGEAPSATNAARFVVAQAKGRGPDDGKVSRLVMRYGKIYPAV